MRDEKKNSIGDYFVCNPTLERTVTGRGELDDDTMTVQSTVPIRYFGRSPFFFYVRNNLTLTSYESLGRGGITPFYHQFYGKYDFRVSNFEFQGQRYQAESKRR